MFVRVFGDSGYVFGIEFSDQLGLTLFSGSITNETEKEIFARYTEVEAKMNSLHMVPMKVCRIYHH